MAGIDLLFDVKNNSERLHQLTLGSILIRSQILSKIGISSKPKEDDFGWEPKGRSFDLSIKLENDSHAWIEIKIDSHLSDNQLNKQLDFILNDPEKKKDHILFLLFGFTQYTKDLSKLRGYIDEKKGDHLGLLKVIPACEFIKILEEVLQSSIPYNSSSKGMPRDVRDLIVSYRDSLINLENRCKNYYIKNISEWKMGDYYGFFNDCRGKIQCMKDLGMGYVPNKSGGFEGCWWGGQEIRDNPYCNLFLLFEKSTLCFKINTGDTKDKAMRNKISKMIIEFGRNKSFRVEKPAKFGNGNFMTVAVVKDFIPINGSVDWEQLKTNIGEAEDIVKQVMNLYLLEANKNQAPVGAGIMQN